MRSTAGHLTCTACGHQVNPRSERCDVDHPLCSATGCRSKVSYWPLGPVVTAREAVEHMRPALATPPTRLVDLASYQEGISLPAVLAAGFTAVNVKLTQGNWYRWAAGKAYADSARGLGMGISTFSWIDNSATGAAQAAYAYQQMRAIGGPDGCAHQCDCEDSVRPATFAIWRDYINWWQDKLGRPIANYTGDWWWQPRGWDGASLTPYLWASPNSGYLSSYPGDTSSAWHAGYGGWTDYSLLQYAVQAVTGAGGGNLSKTAIRDPHVWTALTGGKTDMARLMDDADGKFLVPRLESMAWLLDAVTMGPEQDRQLEFVAWAKRVEGYLKTLVERPPTQFTADQIGQIATAIGDKLAGKAGLTAEQVKEAVAAAVTGLTFRAQ
jgi:hypothetical protein